MSEHDWRHDLADAVAFSIGQSFPCCRIERHDNRSEVVLHVVWRETAMGAYMHLGADVPREKAPTVEQAIQHFTCQLWDGAPIAGNA